MQIRDSEDRHGAVLGFTSDEWNAFLAGVRDGEFDLTSGTPFLLEYETVSSTCPSCAAAGQSTPGTSGF